MTTIQVEGLELMSDITVSHLVLKSSSANVCLARSGSDLAPVKISLENAVKDPKERRRIMNCYENSHRNGCGGKKSLSWIKVRRGLSLYASKYQSKKFLDRCVFSGATIV